MQSRDLSLIVLTFGVLNLSSALAISPRAMAMVDLFDSSNIEASPTNGTQTQNLEVTVQNVQASSTADPIICPLRPPFNCDGTNQDDIIIGTPAGDTIRGFEGNDKIQGNQQPDIVFGGPGDDIISGGEGTDTLFGEDGNDVILSDSGTNVIFGGGGASLFGGKGDDTLLGGSDNDVFTGGPGHDYFDCNEGWDVVTDFNKNDDTANANCEKLQNK
jgi:Ca2+-binding RTX toxin-like protein